MYFITFTDMLGTRGERVARQVGENLKYTFFGEKELFQAAEKMGFLSDVQRMGEKGPALVDQFFSEKPRIFLDRLQSVIYEVAKEGNGIFYGRGSQLLLNSFGCALHVLVIGSTNKRIERVMEEQKVGREMAEKMVHRSDNDKKSFLRFAFHEDWLNPGLYDLVLNMDKLSVGAAAKMVVEAAKSEEVKSCGIDSVSALGKLSLHRKVESVLLEAGVMSPYIFVDVEGMDAVRVYGMIHSPDEKDEVEAALKRVKGVKTMRSDLTLLRGGAA
jgi:cytidylate kinase